MNKVLLEESKSYAFYSWDELIHFCSELDQDRTLAMNIITEEMQNERETTVFWLLTVVYKGGNDE